MAQRMYSNRDFTDMPVLAGTLKETGWDNADILARCLGTVTACAGLLGRGHAPG